MYETLNNDFIVKAIYTAFVYAQCHAYIVVHIKTGTTDISDCIRLDLRARADPGFLLVSIML